MTMRVDPKKSRHSTRLTRIVPVGSSPQLRMELGINEQEGSYTFGQVMDYLDSADVGEARTSLQEGQAR